MLGRWPCRSRTIPTTPPLAIVTTITKRVDQLRSALIASDPGLLRLRSACRTTLAVAVAAALFGALLHVAATTVFGAATGVTFALMGASLPREPSLRDRLSTAVAMAGTAALATAGTAAAMLVPALGEAAFLLILFGAVAVQTRGPRAIACGLAAVVHSYLALFLKVDPEHLESGLAAFPAALAVVAVTTSLILPERPRAALGRIITTVRRRGSILLHAIAEPGAAEPSARLRRRRLFGELNETILSAEDQLALLDPQAALRVSDGLLRFEVALIQVASFATAGGLGRVERARIRLAALRLTANRSSRLRGRLQPTRALAAALVDVEANAAHLVEDPLPELSRATPVRTSPPRPAPAWRPATRAGIAAFLSMVGGYLISPDRWFWAVLTAYLVFLGARSRGDTIVKGVQRLWGTLVGLVVGVLVSVALTGHPALEAAGILICVFGLAYVFAVSQTLAIFCVTVLLGLVYSLLGASAEAILVMRLEETAIGAAAAICVGLVVLPRKTRDLVNDDGSALLAALARVARFSGARLAGRQEGDPVAAMRQADRSVRDLRAALRPLQAPRALVWWARSPSDLPAILICLFWMRVLAATASSGAGRTDNAALSEQAERVAARLEGLAGQPTDPSAPDGSSRHAPLEVAVEDLTPAGADLVTTALDNLERILDVMAERFATEGWNALVTRRPI